VLRVAERHKLYEYDYSTGKIRLKNKICPKCGRVMAFHKQPVPRWHCGFCNYVEYVRQGS
jgi:small subunit ribosomal protein S27Ae